MLETIHYGMQKVDGFKHRFGAFLELRPEVNEAILASVTHPYFKMRWLPPQMASKKKRIQELMLQAATDLGLVTESEASTATATVEEEEDFFIFTEDVEVFQKPNHSRVTAFFRVPKEGLAILGPVPPHQKPFCKVQHHHSVFCSSGAFIFLCWTD